MDKNPRHNICAAILAGGASTRMGTSKAVLNLNGKKLIEYSILTVSMFTDDIMIVSNNPSELSFLKYPVHKDIIPNMGHLGGIYTALKLCIRNKCIVLACDMPFVTKDIIKLLINKSAHHNVTALELKTGIEPLCAIYSKGCLSSINRQMKKRELKVSDFYSNVDNKIIKIENLARSSNNMNAFLNINTHVDLQNAEKLISIHNH